ncbi:MAG: hypothetical protein K6G56_09210 [Clostridiales bacterium]|nr:hypothetical protein [Clostridiales bacterium]
MFFRVVYSVSNEVILSGIESSEIKALTVGLVEMTNGLWLLSLDRSGFSLPLCAFLLSFGGLCIFIQSKMLFEKLRAKEYFLTKLIVGICSALLFALLYKRFPLSAETFADISGPSLGGSKRTLTMILSFFPAVFSLALTAILIRIAAKKKEPRITAPKYGK